MGHFNTSADIVDLRDVIEEGREFLETWQDETADAEEREEAKAALEQLAELAAQLGYAGKAGTTSHYSETLDSLDGYAQDEPTMIEEHYFETYARELAEDIGAVQSDAGWPGRHIDWAAAAEELKTDYNEVDFDGEAYLIRAV